jgi:hypothetical protein
MPQRHAVEKLHDDEGMAILLPDLMNRADVGMIKRRCGLRLALEPSQGLWVFDDVIGQEFEGDKAVEGNVLGLVDHAHPAPAKLFDDAVVRDGLADH